MENARRTQAVLTARRAGLVGCTGCGKVHAAGDTVCRRCGASLQSRDAKSLQRVWAWLAAGMVAYIPANIYPMLLTTNFGKTQENTIVGGAIELFLHGSWGVALIVFAASVLIPIGKFIAIGYLALSARSKVVIRGHGRQHLYEVVEFIGRWSMIDVFVVAILSALVRFDFAATVNPGIAAVSFALSVAFTMISAQNFDPRTLWDAYEEDDT
ncbi:paraquat-inducible protein A [Defluviimonas sp. WL0024]|uniref:Paraquat-inducible protein A n=2 Tax=Albidovulum TaxID=205889 RepID=A0ABT3J279_9RHOB|nr:MULTISPECIES: paraquat-inducible protein A [Defluviimonas]MCU9847782.1 paraquat-inducible protein A [Defluviimonas sp. WL0024]MCW3781790.1 paraquat-inducible protein A [Defluviimonas salinarum]